MTTRAHTVSVVAGRLGISIEQTYALIRSRALEAFDVSLKPGVGRPSYRVSEEAIDQFLVARRAGQAPATRGRRQKRPDYKRII